MVVDSGGFSTDILKSLRCKVGLLTDRMISQDLGQKKQQPNVSGPGGWYRTATERCKGE